MIVNHPSLIKIKIQKSFFPICLKSRKLFLSSCFSHDKKANRKVSKGLFEDYEITASSVTINTGYTESDVIEGIGIVNKHEIENGSCYYTVLPNTKYSRRKSIINCFSEESSHLRSKMKNFRQFSVIQHAFLGALPLVTPECITGANFYFEDGLRKVTPYFYLYNHIVTGISGSLTLLDYQKKLLPRVAEEFLKYRLQEGFVWVNFIPSGPDRLVQNGDFLTSLSHFHEDPVFDDPIDIIYEDDDSLVVNKPPSIQISPSNKQRMNCLSFILAKDKGFMNLRPAHRLDKHTSGVCIMSKNAVSSRRIHKMFQDESRYTKKKYLALVEGSFPEKKIVMKEPISSFYLTSSFQKHFSSPKDCVTIFERLEHNTNTSLILCTPLTGRTHQIRIHLQKLGFPIIGDYLYNDVDRLIRYEDDKDTMSKIYLQTMDGISPLKNKSSFSCNPIEGNKDCWKEILAERLSFSAPGCLECTMGETYLRQRAIDSMSVMCLHSWQYQIGNLELKSQLPKWATDSNFVQSLLKKRSEKTFLKSPQ